MRTRIQQGLAGYPYSIRDVHISDPCILADEKTGRYYTYVQFIDRTRFPEAAAEEMAFYVLESPDLVNWSAPSVCFRRGDFWADKDYWAPEVHLWKGKYYLLSTFRAKGTYRRCQALVSDSPRGPFQPVGEPLTPEGWQCLDGTLYIDRKGSPWLIFAHEWLQVYDGQICAVPVADDLSHAIGDPLVLFRASDASWVGKAVNGNSNVTDGPFLYRLKSGKLIMLWSSFSKNGAYITGYARSLSGDIQGPWVQTEQPLYGLDGAHSMLFRAFSGQLMMALHCPNDHPKKRILLFEMEETEDGVQVVNEVTGNWFTSAGGNAAPYLGDAPLNEDFWFAKDPRQSRPEGL